MDGIAQWWSAILGAVGPPVPTVFLRLTEGLTKVKKASVAVNVPGTAQPGWTDLVRLGGPPERRPPPENVTGAINDKRDTLQGSLGCPCQSHSPDSRDHNPASTHQST